MIAYLKGIVTHKNTKQVVVEVNGVGYAVDIPPKTVADLPTIGAPVTFYTHYYQNRENDITLYGFTSRDALQVFEMALTVKGVGPTLAQNIVARLAPPQFQRAVHREDTTTLMRVPRLNKEIALLIINKLKKNIGKVKFEGTVDLAGPGAGNAEVINILVNLGASELDAALAVEKAEKLLGNDAPHENLVKQALRYIRN